MKLRLAYGTTGLGTLSAVEHPKYWTEDKQRSFIEALIPLLVRSSPEGTP